MFRYLMLQIKKSKTALYSLLLKFIESCPLHEYFENFEKASDKCSQKNSLLVKLQFFGFAAVVSMGSLVRTTVVTKSTKIFFRKTNNENQMYGKKLMADISHN